MAKFRDNNRNIFLDNGFFLVLQSFQAFGNTTTFSNHIVKLFALGGDFPLQTLSLPMVLIGILRVAIHFGQKIHKVRIGLMFCQIILQTTQILLLPLRSRIEFLQFFLLFFKRYRALDNIRIFRLPFRSLRFQKRKHSINRIIFFVFGKVFINFFQRFFIFRNTIASFLDFLLCCSNFRYNL